MVALVNPTTVPSGESGRVKGGRSPAKRTLDATDSPLRSGLGAGVGFARLTPEPVRRRGLPRPLGRG
jgi:hypothetical protein